MYSYTIQHKQTAQYSKISDGRAVATSSLSINAVGSVVVFQYSFQRVQTVCYILCAWHICAYLHNYHNARYA
jgi:hypothetical protein